MNKKVAGFRFHLPLCKTLYKMLKAKHETKKAAKKCDLQSEKVVILDSRR